MDRRSEGKSKVAVLGAGPSGLAAAFALSRTAELRERYEVTVYQAGWRAGGKSATGRAMNKGWRIEQNGSHYLFGCYGNSFAMVREAYEVLKENGVTAFGDYRDQFVPRTLLVGLKEHESTPWFAYLPETLEWPDVGGKYPPPSQYFFLLVQYVVWFFLYIFSPDQNGDGSRGSWAEDTTSKLFPLSPFNEGAWPRLIRGVCLPIARFIDIAVLALGVVVGRPLAWVVGRVPPSLRKVVVDLLVDALESFLDMVHNLARLIRSPRLRVGLDLFSSGALGALEDRVWEAGRLETLDAIDFRCWLRKHGASKESVDCALVKSWYDAVVAYENGEPHRARISAGVTIYSLFRAFVTYKGAFAYQMKDEIGDAFIGPIVKALELRKVKFRFFCRVRDVVAGAGPEHSDLVTRIVIENQEPAARRRQHKMFVDLPVEAKPGQSGAPLRPVWPNQPVFADDPRKLEDYDDPELPQCDSSLSPPAPRNECDELVLGEDFDRVIFALPLDVVSDHPDGDFTGLHRQPCWLGARANVKSAATQSIRLWFNESLAELGWLAPAPILSGFSSPFSTWEDNGQNRGNEAFFKLDLSEPLAIATLFGPLQIPNTEGGASTKPSDLAFDPPEDLQQRILDDVIAGALSFYEQRIPRLFPTLLENPFAVLLSPSTTTYVDSDSSPTPSGGDGKARFAWQYASANVGASARYVLALPGTLVHRIRPDETGFRNMWAAGEWTRNGFEVGCVEGAVISGLGAAQALSGMREAIVGQDDLSFGPFRVDAARLPRPLLPDRSARPSVRPPAAPPLFDPTPTR
jgi:uncharacterized protein with NAD-binding domain and iron-sulfur cluster